MNFIYSVIGYPLGWVIWFFYNFLGKNYLLSLFLFTLFTRLLLLPSTIKQQKMMVKNAKFKPKLEALQKKYGNNKQKYQEEMMKLYEKEGFNPMSGCLPMLIQFPILFGLIDVVYKPLTHILRLPSDVIKRIGEIAAEVGQKSSMHAEIYAISNPEAFSALGEDVVNKIQSINMNYFGLNLGEQPTWALNLLILIPILSGLTSALASFISTRFTADPNAAANGTMKGMMVIMPLISLWFSFQVPAGVGLYWIFSNVISIVQTVVLHKIYDPQKIAAEQLAAEEQKKEDERQARIEARKNAQKEAKEEGKEIKLSDEALSQKEINKRKIAEARKRMAEKYGEEYKDEED